MIKHKAMCHGKWAIIWSYHAHSLDNSEFCATNILQIVDFTAQKEKYIYQHTDFAMEKQ